MYEKHHFYKAAEAAYVHSLGAYPDNKFIHQYYGLFLERMGRMDEGKKHVKLANEL